VLNKYEQMDKYVKGPAEAALSMVTAVPAGILGHAAAAGRGVIDAAKGLLSGETSEQAATRAANAARRAEELTASLTYVPRTEEGRDVLQGVKNVFDATKLQGLGPTEAMTMGALASTGPRLTARNAVPSVGGTIGEVARSVTSPLKTSFERPPPAATQAGGGAQYGSAGAAGANVGAQARAMSANASPELQAAVEKVADKMTPQGLLTLERHVDADTLPVPVPLMKGQATRDPGLISKERDLRGKNQELQTRINDQNKALTENTHAIRDKAGPDVFDNTPSALGQGQLDAIKAIDKAKREAVSANYKALQDAAGGQLPLDVAAFKNELAKNLSESFKTRFVPSELKQTLRDVEKKGVMTFADFENLRTIAAEEIRSAQAAGKGNQKGAAIIVRKTLEDMPMPPGAGENLKRLADAARKSAREYHEELEATPAAKAVVRGKANADKFIQKYVVGADGAQVSALKNYLAGNDSAQQSLAVGVLRHLQDKAGIITGENFSQAGYNRALEGVRSKLPVVFSPEVLSDVEKLGRVARYVQSFPAGHTVNTSNTWVNALANAAEYGGNLLTLHHVPIGSVARNLVQQAKAVKEVKGMLEPGAGLTIKEIAEGGKKR
jgi:hypothetical protein